MKNVAIIVARGGSKRIPRKNIRSFLGKPIIFYSIEVATSCRLFEKVIVSTDDSEIAELSKTAGAEVPFFRSPRNSDDYAGTADVIIEVLNELSKLGLSFDNVCCIYPTAPFIRTEHLVDSFQKLIDKNYDTVFPVCQYGFPVLRSLKIEDDGKISMMWPENMDKRSQDLPPVYHDAGQFYWGKTSAILAKRQLYTDNTGAIILDELEVQDIDNLIDWQIAEVKYKLLKNKNELQN
jgi:pseudaminic acid cytidylyltransferase